MHVGRSKPRSAYDRPEDRGKRDPLAAGDDASWRAITAGTVLGGSGYR